MRGTLSMLGAIAVAVYIQAEVGSSKNERLVSQVESVRVSQIKHADAIKLRVDARATVKSLGWTDPRLILEDASNSATIELRFVADAPDGICAQALGSVGAHTVITADPGAHDKIIVRGERNHQEFDLNTLDNWD